MRHNHRTELLLVATSIAASSFLLIAIAACTSLAPKTSNGDVDNPPSSTDNPTNPPPDHNSSGSTIDDNGGAATDGNADAATDDPTSEDTATEDSAVDGGETSPPDADSTLALASLQVFPPDNPWNQDISEFPAHPNSEAYIRSIGLDTGLHPDFGTVWEGAPIGIPFVTVRADQPKVPVSFYYEDESDPGPYPIPPDAPIEGGANSDGDRHVLVVDLDNNKLYEMFDAHPRSDGGWDAGSGAVFDLTSNELRRDGWTSADAAGLSIFAGLVRYDEVVERGEITHAVRFTVSRTQRAYIPPATHFASSNTDPDLPPMGLRVRLRADYDISGFSTHVQTILRALKRYGMFVSDNGSNWYITGAPDPRWNDEELSELSAVKGRDFEAVYTGDPKP